MQTSASVTVATFGDNFGNDANEFYALPQTLLSAGTYQIVVSGVNSPSQASCSGTVAVTAVPEPATGAMLLAGLGMVGFMLRRRT